MLNDLDMKGLPKLAEHAQEYAGYHCRTDDTGYVGSHGMHQQEIARVFLLAQMLGHPCRHGNCSNDRC